MGDPSIRPGDRRLRLSADCIVFPPRCVRCGRPSKFERLIRKYRGTGLILYAMIMVLQLEALFMNVLHLPEFMRPGPMFTLRVPVCRRCREYHAFLQYAAIFAVLVATMFTAGITISMLFCSPDDFAATLVLSLLIAAAALAVLYVADRVMFRFIDGALGVRIESYSPEGRTATLRFRDPSLAEEMLRLNPAGEFLDDP